MIDPKTPKELPPITGSGDLIASSATLAARGRVFRKPSKNHPIYAVIGRVAAEWAELEHQLDMIIWRLAGPAEEGSLIACLTSQMIGHFPRFNAILALVTALDIDDELKKQIRRESGKVSELAEFRARAIHDAWYVDIATNDPHQFKSRPRKKLNFGLEPRNTTELDSIIQQIAQRVEAIKTLANTLCGYFPWRGK